MSSRQEFFSFAGKAAQEAKELPLAARMAPRSLSEFVGQEDLLGPGRMLRRLIEAGSFSSAIFFGPTGTGKTALVRVIASGLKAAVADMNAVSAGVPELRRLLAQAGERTLRGEKTLLLVDEIHHFTRTQQDVLLPAVERGEAVLIGLTTENPSFYVNAALLSRLSAFEFKPLAEEDLATILDRALGDTERGVGALAVELDARAREHFLRSCQGDARRLLNALELAALSTRPDSSGRRRVDLAVAEECARRRMIRYDKKSDDHYDHISAFIKSLRGSDPDAALYWMAKMLAAGEDPRFIARRLVIAASEDVGLADSRALLVAQAASGAVERIGLPEAKIPLAHAAVYLALAPKSNSAYMALSRAEKEVQSGPAREVPQHLRDASMDRKTRGHGEGYRYPHDFPGHYTPQVYMPEPVELYQPGDEGDEKRLKERRRRPSLDALKRSPS